MNIFSFDLSSVQLSGTNIRHYENLLRAKAALMDVQGSIDSGITNDFLAMELKYALSALSEITHLHPIRDYGGQAGEEITTEDLLENPPTLPSGSFSFGGHVFVASFVSESSICF